MQHPPVTRNIPSGFTLPGLCRGQRRELSASALLAILLAVTVMLPVRASAAPAGPPPAVTVITVTEQNVNPVTEYVGHVEAIQAVDLQSRVSGFIEKIYFREGSQVRAGELLYLIEPARYRMQVAVNRARVVKAQAAVKETLRLLRRFEAMPSGAIPVTDLEAAEASAERAQAELQEAQALLDLAQIDLDYTRITAPISGRIGATRLSVGNLCAPTSAPLARIVQLDPIRVVFSISENELSVVQLAQADAANEKSSGVMRPRLKLPDGTLAENVGRIDFVDNRVDPSTGTVAVRIRFANPDGLLLPGQYVKLVAGQTAEKMLPVIPQGAVLEDREGRYLLLVDEDNKVVQRRIVTGATVDYLWAVESGLAAGERVIVEGLQKVKPGQLVTIGGALSAPVN